MFTGENGKALCFKKISTGLLVLTFILVLTFGAFFYGQRAQINYNFPLFSEMPISSEQIAEASPESYWDNLWLLARVIQAEAGDEPFLGKVAVGAVILNRTQSSAFPRTLSGVIFQPFAFESVANGLIWWRPPSLESIRAAASALSGWDPTYGALYFWNPSKPVNPWIWTRQIITQIGNHVFAR